MAKVKMLTAMGGLGFNYSYGDVIELDPREAKRWCDHGAAELAPANAEVKYKHAGVSRPNGDRETAAVDPASETADVRGGVSRGGPIGDTPRPSPHEGKGKGKKGAKHEDDAGK